MTDNAALDEEILVLVELGWAFTSREAWLVLRGSAHPNTPYAVVKRLFQSLRKRGLIVYDRSTGWRMSDA